MSWHIQSGEIYYAGQRVLTDRERELRDERQARSALYPDPSHIRVMPTKGRPCTPTT